MRALVVGLGSIGRRHLSNLKAVVPDAEICVWRPLTASADHETIESADTVVFNREDALSFRPDVAIISTPAPTHTEIALTLAGAGVHLLVEKPVSDSMEGLHDLIEICKLRGIVLMVGYNLRFSSSMLAVRHALEEGMIGRLLSIRAEVGQYLPDWRPGADYRVGVSARRDSGGGVLLELSHEIDYITWLAGGVTRVAARAGHLSDLEIEVEDTAEILFDFASGAIGSVHLDMLDRAKTRACRIIGTEGTITWDGISRGASIYTAVAGEWSELFRAESDDKNDMYVDEIKHFLACVSSGAAPVVDGGAGRRVLELVLAARKSAVEGSFVAV